MIDLDIKKYLSFDEFLTSFKSVMKTAFYERDDINKFSLTRGFPPVVLRDIMATNPLSVAIPSEYGGRGCHVKECLGILSAASYESLPLSLTFGINLALFLEPTAKYAHEDIKHGIFNRFLTEQNMGGLMITEPDYGSDALNMQTSSVKKGEHYHIKGTKHWQGLTGMADYWIMTSRGVKENGELNRDLDLFICDEQDADQRIEVEEYFNGLGLYPIPYGKNKIDIKVPEKNKLIPESTGLKMLMDLLHRSRFQFPGMGLGFIKRMMDEAIKHCKERFVGGKPLFELDQVKYQISKIQSAYTLSSAMCVRSSAYSGIDKNLATDIVEANSIKAYLTDLMQESAQLLTQLCGANGYKMENIGGRGTVDSRPFQVFEGANDMLYSQIGDMVLKLMKRKKEFNFYAFLSEYNLTEKVVGHFKNVLNFSIDGPLSQRKIVDLGKTISRIVCSNHVIDLGASGFRPDLIGDCLKSVHHDIHVLLSSFNNQTSIEPIIDYQDNGCWMSFA